MATPALPPLLPIVISGLGPAGLACAIEAAKKGYPVIGIDKRRDYLRTQRVTLTTETLMYLIKLFFSYPDPRFQEKLMPENFSLQIKDLERYFLHVLKHFSQVTLLQSNMIQSIDTTACKIILDNGQEIAFQHLIAADGVHHDTVNRYNAQAPSAQQIHYQASKISFLGPNKHFVSTLIVSDGEKAFDLEKKKLDLYQTNYLHEFGYTPQDYENNIVLLDKTRRKIYIVGRLPKKITDLSDPTEQEKERLNWAKIIACLQCNVSLEGLTLPQSKKHPKEKEKLNFQIFSVQGDCAKQGMVACGQDHYLCLVGDAYQPPVYILGHGVNDAIATAELLGRALQEANTAHPGNSLNPDPLQAHYKALRSAWVSNLAYLKTIATFQDIQLDLKSVLPIMRMPNQTESNIQACENCIRELIGQLGKFLMRGSVKLSLPDLSAFCHAALQFLQQQQISELPEMQRPHLQKKEKIEDRLQKLIDILSSEECAFNTLALDQCSYPALPHHYPVAK